MATGLPIWWWIAAGVLTPAALWLVWWSLINDRFTTRAKTRRRCPKCWYDLAAAAQPTRDEPVTCPECGKRIKRERSLRKTRRRYAVATVSLAVLLAVPASHRGLTHGWWSLMPTVGLLMLERHYAEYFAHGQPPAPRDVISQTDAIRQAMRTRDLSSIPRWALDAWLDDHPSLRMGVLSLEGLSEDQVAALGLPPGSRYVYRYGRYARYAMQQGTGPSLRSMPGSDWEVAHMLTAGDCSVQPWVGLAASTAGREVETHTWELLRPADGPQDRVPFARVSTNSGINAYSVFISGGELGVLVDPRLESVRFDLVLAGYRDNRADLADRSAIATVTVRTPAPSPEVLAAAPRLIDTVDGELPTRSDSRRSRTHPDDEGG